MPTGLYDVLTSDADFGDVDLVDRAGETGGSGDGTAGLGDGTGTVPTADDSFGTGERRDVSGDFATGAFEFTTGLRNLGPNWLDEAAAVGVVVLVVGALLYLARPLLTIIANLTGD